MTRYVQRGTTFQVTEDADLTIFNKLPAATYTIGFDENGGRFYLKTVENFQLGKIYGDIPKKAQRIINTYRSREFSTGALLSGEKGCGKTMLAKLISVEGIKQGIPTVIINSPWTGEGFNKFVQSIEQECIFVFDEYEKVYDRDRQSALLTLLDGVYPTHKLFILTTNDRWAISDYMKNRPGRLFYNIEYQGLPTDFITEYCEDNLKNKKHIAGVVQLSNIFESFNFDMLKAVVEEMNRYNEPAHEAIKLMNIKAESYGAQYHVNIKVDNKEMPVYHSIKELNPLKEFYTGYFLTAADAKVQRNYQELTVTPENCIKIQNGTYTFVVDNAVITLRKKAHSQIDLADLVDVA